MGGPLRGRIVGLPSHTRQRRSGGHYRNRPEVIGEHVRQELARDPIQRQRINLKCRCHIVVALFKEGLTGHDTSIVDEEVDSADALTYCLTASIYRLI